MSVPGGPTPDKVMPCLTGGWAVAILGSAPRHGVFNALEGAGDVMEKMWPLNRSVGLLE